MGQSFEDHTAPVGQFENGLGDPSRKCGVSALNDSNQASLVTQMLRAAGEGDVQAAADLLPLIFTELRKLARARMAKTPPGNTLKPTALSISVPTVEQDWRFIRTFLYTLLSSSEDDI